MTRPDESKPDDPVLRAWVRTVRSNPDRAAVTQAWDGRASTFGELDLGSRAWLERQAAPVREVLRGRPVVFGASNGIAWFEIFIGLIRAGAVVAPIDPSEPEAARREQARTLRAAFWWDGERLAACDGTPRRLRAEIRLIKLTSGTTGRPRPLRFTSEQILADARNVTATMRIDARDVNYAVIPLGHSYGLGNLTVPLLARGVPLVCGASPLPHAIAADFSRWRPTVFPGVPALWRALAASDADPEALSSLRLAISAGSPLPAGTAEEFAARYGRRIHNFYGSSETGGIAFDRTGDFTLAGGVGTPLKGVEVAPLARRRIRVCSPSVFTSGNRRRLGRTGCWIPPDEAAIDPRGSIRLLGRRGPTAKIAGRRIHPAEIAAKIRSYEGVRDAWVEVSAGPHPSLGAVVASDRTAADLRARLHGEIAAWKIPKKILVLPALPLTATGKVDSRALRGLLGRQHAVHQARLHPGTA